MLAVTPKEWAEIALADPQTVILDTETTGLPRGARPEYIVELAIIARGKTLFDEQLDPRWLLPRAASAANGIYPDELIGRRTFSQALPEIHDVLAGKHVLAWNAPFDRGIFLGELVREQQYTGRTFPELNSLQWFDPCDVYRTWLQEHNCYESGAAKLNGPHRARGDCLLVVEKLKEMAFADKPNPPSAGQRAASEERSARLRKARRSGFYSH